MPLYRLALRTISRGRGELSVATAAYIAAVRLYLETEHWTYDWSWRVGDVVHSELIGAHGWSREELWNEAEWVEWERRWDGVTAREIIVALPSELSPEQRIALARELAEYLRDRYGVAVDLAVHRPNIRGGQDERNWHAHLLITRRVMSPSGLGERVAVWDHKRTGGPELEVVRAEWGRMYNAALERSGLDARVDHRSYERQGLDLLAGRHLGPVLSRLERAGTRTEGGDYNRGIEILNQIRSLVGTDLKWDWEEKARNFTDKDGRRAHAACRLQLFRLAQSEAAMEGDRRALGPAMRREIRVRRKELAKLMKLLDPCRHAAAQESIRQRKLRRKERQRGRGSSGRGRTD